MDRLFNMDRLLKRKDEEASTSGSKWQSSYGDGETSPDPWSEAKKYLDTKYGDRENRHEFVWLTTRSEYEYETYDSFSGLDGDDYKGTDCKDNDYKVANSHDTHHDADSDHLYSIEQSKQEQELYDMDWSSTYGSVSRRTLETQYGSSFSDQSACCRCPCHCIIL